MQDEYRMISLRRKNALIKLLTCIVFTSVSLSIQNSQQMYAKREWDKSYCRRRVLLKWQFFIQIRACFLQPSTIQYVLLFFEGRREKSRKLSFSWKILTFIGHHCISNSSEKKSWLRVFEIGKQASDADHVSKFCTVVDWSFKASGITLIASSWLLAKFQSLWWPTHTIYNTHHERILNFI